MGADMLAATLVARVETDKKFEPDWEAGHAAIDALVLTDKDGAALDELWQDWEFDGSNEDQSEWDPKVSLHKILDALKDNLFGREVTVHTYPNMWLFIAGGMSWGDAPEPCQPIWTLSNFDEVLSAVGFLPWADAVLVDQTHIADHAIVEQLRSLPWGLDEDINGGDLVDSVGELLQAYGRWPDYTEENA